MNKKLAIYSIITLLTASAATTSVTAKEWKQAQNPRQPHNNPMHQGMQKTTQVDKSFIEMMIPHHQGAVEMAQMAVKQAKSPEVKKLAESIIKDQNREIQQMRTWYKQWYGAELPTTGMNMQHHGMGKGMMTAMQHQEMMDREMMVALKNASNFDREFLRQMTSHHEMALMMAGMVVDSAAHPETRKLAESIIQSQSAEINKMGQLAQTIK